MENYIITIEKALTSYVFYEYVLNRLHDYFKEKNNSRIYFDFSLCTSIDSLVIPNLLCIGHIIKVNTNKTPYFYIPDTYESGKLKKYLNDINFVLLAKRYNIYEFDESIDCGLVGKNIEKLNTTIYFSANEDEDETWNKIVGNMVMFSKKYLEIYKDYNAETLSNNVLVEFCKELVENTKIHGNSFSFLTVQVNFYLKKIYISVSDCGVGFKKTINDKFEQDLERYKILNCIANDEKEAIIQGVFSRKGSRVYGLYNVIRKTLENQGLVRLHSNDTQIVFTPRLLSYFNEQDVKIIEFISDKNLTKNIRTEKKYGGVHVEFELPLPNGSIID